MNSQQVAMEIAQLLKANGIITMVDDQIELSIIPTRLVHGRYVDQCSALKWAEINFKAARICLNNWDREIDINLNNVRMMGADVAVLNATMEEMQMFLSAMVDECLVELYKEAA